jgi:hypothetical protein
MNKMAEQELFNTAFAQFKKTLAEADLLKKINDINIVDGYGYAARIELTRGKTAEYLTFLIYTNLALENLGVVEQRVKTHVGRVIVVARYVTPQMADKLREKQINFLDTVGNVFLDTDAIYLFIKGNKPDTDRARQAAPRRVFNPGGLKVIFALLCLPGLENAPLREIATKGGVALGTVGKVMKNLKYLGYLHDMGDKGRFLKKKEQLLGKWVEEYPLQLMPKQHLGYFTAMDEAWLTKINLNKYKAVWGGEAAAALLTGYLKPQEVAIYINDEPTKLIVENRLKKDPAGKIEIRQAFWDFAEADTPWPQEEIAPPILVYADLLATGDTRNIETAQQIYDQTILGLIRED